MHRMTWASTCLILGSAFIVATLAPISAEPALQGNWTATKAERDGKPAADVVGHHLSLAADRFQIRSRDGKLVYGGTVRLDAKAKPAAVDFENAEGIAKGQAWKGIYKFDGETLTIVDNAPDPAKPRPTAFEAKSGSGYVLVTFTRAKP